ncbi:Conserved hypothetical protein 2001 [hydrothermal vent metagenome]|uniref:Uncharacterized protein n=1 Tax=hydrothermal vent metagenome TaxID=652676 RepID=A0A1W1CPF4_9ZZZZ
MKKISLIILSILSLTVFANGNEETSAISANVAIANDYVWRGLGQHQNSAGTTVKKTTVSGGLDYDLSNGFAVGVWGSNISVNGNATESDGSIEMDLYGSYSNEYKDVGYEVGYISYQYPGRSDLNFKESYLSLSYKEFGLSHYLQEDSNTNYTEVSYAKTFEGIDTSISYGDYNVKDDAGQDTGNKVWTLGLAKEFNGLEYSVSLIKTNFDDSATDNKESVVFSIGKSF